MSADLELEADMSCASCGIAQVDDIKLKRCTCKLVRYCSVKCQHEHRSQHKGACKKQVAELHDVLLFKQPESSHLGDCPICCLPLPLDESKETMYPCCSKVICNGCSHANDLREKVEMVGLSCPFCREPVPRTRAQTKLNQMKRVEANDPAAIYEVGVQFYDDGDFGSAFEHLTKAAGLGDIRAHYQLSLMYHFGQGVEKDEKRRQYHSEQAAIGGHPMARGNLGYAEWKKNGRVEKAAKHFIIAANLGHDTSIKVLRKLYALGFVKKDDLAAALRAHKVAVDATKSPQRDAAAKAAARQN